MYKHQTWPDPVAHIRKTNPDAALFYFAPAVLQATARRFQAGFDGLVTYAVKANAGPEVLENLVMAGISTFDVASPQEMQAVRAVCPDAVLHYNNPVRSTSEIAEAMRMGVVSYSVDSRRELDKIPAHDCEIAVRLALPVKGAAYDFGEKFGVSPEGAIPLLREVAARGFTSSITFHPGTQCADPAAWRAYIEASAQVAQAAGVKLARLNVGGGFAAHRAGPVPDLEALFASIRADTTRAFGPEAPALLCEPGRAMVSDAFTLATRVRALRETGAVFLNDGIYGGFAEARDIGAPGRITVMAADGTLKTGDATPRVVFGPTCDSLDRLPGEVPLPVELAEGDYMLFAGMGAYSRCLSTNFNGYGAEDLVTVERI